MLHGWRFLSQKSSKTSILRFERGTNSIFDPKIIENIDFAVRKRYQLDFWPKNRRKHRFCGSKEVLKRFVTQKIQIFLCEKKNARIFCKINISIDFMIAKFRKFWTKNRKNGQNKIHPKSRAPRSPLRLHLKNNLRQTMPPKKQPLPTQLLPHDRPQ